MAWFRKTTRKEEPPEGKEQLWTVCPGCKAHIYAEEWSARDNVCPKCNFHDRIPWRKRLDLTVDEGTFEEFDADISASDPLNFSDAKGRYSEKTKAAAQKTGLKEAIVTGRGRIHGIQAVLGIMDFRFVGGSLSGSTGEKILLAVDHALRHRYPCVIFSSSGGARMQEGMVSLMQMARTCAGISKLNRAGVPYISVLTHPTTGGVSASYAMVGDLNIAEPGALIGFAGRRVIEQTIKQKLPPDFQTAEFVLKHGFVDKIVPRSNMKDFLHRVLKYWTKK
ncbi:MAG: acetyl-CoA carboxylase, carboxyltransferase subunit beta [Kiritimatiellia bacterium]